MAYYLNRRDQVPGWEVGSVMLFIMFSEIFYLLLYAALLILLLKKLILARVLYQFPFSCERDLFALDVLLLLSFQDADPFLRGFL